MNKYVWGEKLKNGKNKLNYIPVLDGHLSNDLSIIYLFIFLHTGHIAQKKKCLFKISNAADLVYLGTHC